MVVPIVYMAQIVFLAFATNLPAGLILSFTLIASALFEEIVTPVCSPLLLKNLALPLTKPADLAGYTLLASDMPQGQPPIDMALSVGCGNGRIDGAETDVDCGGGV